MTAAERWRAWADLVLILHAGFVLFVVVGLLLVIVGGVRRWPWVRRPWFRWLHAGAIAIVVLQTWLGAICPLTTLEMALRERAGDPAYAGGFIAHWLQRLLYYEAPAWVFALAYTAFGLAVALAWWKVPPAPWRPPRAR